MNHYIVLITPTDDFKWAVMWEGLIVCICNTKEMAERIVKVMDIVISLGIKERNER